MSTSWLCRGAVRRVGHRPAPDGDVVRTSQYSTPDAYLFDSALSDGRYGGEQLRRRLHRRGLDELINSARTALDEQTRLDILSEIQNGPLRRGDVDHARQRGRSHGAAIGSRATSRTRCGRGRLNIGLCTTSEVAPSGLSDHFRVARSGPVDYQVR